MIRHLPSKLIAGGLSAAAVLLWWPHVFATDGGGSWFWRGAVWTLVWEVLLVALVPVEDLLWEQTAWGRAASARMSSAGSRILGAGSLRRRILVAGTLAAISVAIPLGLIFHERPVPAAQPGADRADVTRVVKKVYRPVQVRHVVKEVEVPVPVASGAPAATGQQQTAPSRGPKQQHAADRSRQHEQAAPRGQQQQHHAAKPDKTAAAPQAPTSPAGDGTGTTTTAAPPPATTAQPAG